MLRWRINGKIQLARRQMVAPYRCEMQFPVIREEEMPCFPVSVKVVRNPIARNSMTV
ncbi:hypothetical protein [Actimicrobium sp. CCI2.3]|uniref:hypothetical protein n=1 Tax=Actimicrobium sp. CCI2.3 TaxID=3048616 RepID=UPI002AB3EA33|nr:hypothetical protein [Actimicrobium sp. CCI2.3]MDY7576003.1 hypothetical protein [Actimicrobium sp. CCI2.3]MEB0023316.1 hypothetical protein [Actimicrobium sp. CCI2.3]